MLVKRINVITPAEAGYRLGIPPEILEEVIEHPLIAGLVSDMQGYPESNPQNLLKAMRSSDCIRATVSVDEYGQKSAHYYIDFETVRSELEVARLRPAPPKPAAPASQATVGTITSRRLAVIRRAEADLRTLTKTPLVNRIHLQRILGNLQDELSRSGVSPSP